MANIICLAHFCDMCGPTAIMVTEGLLVGCQNCTQEEEISNSRHLHNQDGSQKGPRTNSSSSEKEIGDYFNPQKQNTPPESPRMLAGPAPFPLRRDSSFHKTYDENDKKKKDDCLGCKLTLPPKTETGDDTLKTKFDTPKSPILRTRKPYERIERIKRNKDPSPPKSASSSDSESAITNKPSHTRSGSKTFKRQGTSSSGSSFDSSSSHDHYRDYTSTHEPLQPLSFSKIRQSCLRTLSCETLPPSSSTPSSPTGSQTSNQPGTTASGGPIFFGDSQAGYTTAYVFRVADPTARGGKKRLYALMCVSPHSEKKSVKQFSHLSAAFKDIASWIQTLADQHIERTEASQNSPKLTPIDEQQLPFLKATRGGSTPTSAFLSGRNRSLGGGFDNRHIKQQSKGLAEMVGMPDFFLELHARFVTLLIALSRHGL